MRKTMMMALCVAALSSLLLASSAGAAEAYRFAIVPKAMNNPYFDLARNGCVEEAKKLRNSDVVALLGGLPEYKVVCSVVAEDALKAAFP